MTSEGGESVPRIVQHADIGEAVTYCPECAEREFGSE
jgi:hypothetical protein